MSFAAVCMIVACLLIMGSFSLVAVNLDNMLGKLESENEFLAYIDEDLTEEEARALQPALEAIPNVDLVSFSTREAARDRYAEKYAGDQYAALFESLPGEVFRHRFSVHVTDLSQMAETVDQVGALPQVANIRAEEELARGFVVVRNVASVVALILVAILIVISLFLIANTIKLATFTRRDEIAIMKMCGATNWFIRWPFIFEGMILGVAGALLAFFLQWGIYQLVFTAISQSDTMALLQIVPFRRMAGRVFATFLGSGFVIGGVGSMLAIGRFLQV
ncbi:MAG: ABC transporter permease [Clostridiales bacterium]|nr:ABC transporter permease [Clostridiales bacterium]